MCGSAITSAGLRTGAHGMRASDKVLRASSTEAKVPSHDSTIGRSSRQFARRFSAVSKRGSRPSSGRPITESKRGQSIARPGELHREIAIADRRHDHARPRVAELLAAVEDGGVRHAVGRDEGLEHRDVEVRALAGAAPCA